MSHLIKAQAREGLWEDEITALDCWEVLQAKITARVDELQRQDAANPTPDLARQQATQEIFANPQLRRPPALHCAGCEKPLREIGGYRITAQQSRGTALTESADLDHSHVRPLKPIQLFAGVALYMAYWGELDLWTAEAIARAKEAYTKGQKPWLCQCCAKRQCHACGAPVNYPAGSDIVRGNGETRHLAIIAADLGCSNDGCHHYRQH